jgi:protein ImuB
MMLKLLQFDLEAHAPGAPVIAVALSVTPVEPRIIQNGLYTPLAPEPEKLELTLAKIRSMVGGQNAGSPELLDTHRPGAWRMRAVGSCQLSVVSCQSSVIRKQRIAFRRFSPPLRARVEVDDNRPKRIFAQRVYGKVLQVAGPWRSSGDWWTGDAWDRDEWDVALNDGGIYRLFVQRPIESWFVEGAYD